MRKWEYLEVAESSGLSFEVLNDYGADGWELVGYGAWDGQVRYCFKREVL